MKTTRQKEDSAKCTTRPPFPQYGPPPSYRLEVLEGRVLLSADVVAAGQISAPTPVEPPPPVVLDVTPAAAGERAAVDIPATHGERSGALGVSDRAPSNRPHLVEAFLSSRPETVPPAHANAVVPKAPPVDTPSTPAAGSHFSRMFPSLAPFAVDTPALREALASIGEEGGIMDPLDDLSDPVTLITDPAKSIRNPDNTAMTAGMTFLGQFLDHDITFDLTSTFEQPSQPEAVQNSRTAAFELDSVYGGGPRVSPHLYDHSLDSRGIKFRIDEIPGSPSVSRGGVMRHDVPRDEHNQALIGDPRNDENLIISQLHLAFLKFHNAIVDQVIETTALKNPNEIFAEAQRTVRWHHQCIIVNEFLPKTVGPELVDRILMDGHGFYTWDDHPLMPVEFSVGAYRFGHSQVRPSYRANFGPAPGQEFFALTFDDSLPASHDHADLRGGERAPRRFVDWQTFFDFGDGNVRPNKQIDTRLSSILFDLPDVPGTEPQSLAQRNLLRHLTFGVPSGQDVARTMGLEPLAPSAFGDLEPLGLHTSTPLWFYVLREAEVLRSGAQLGPVGGRIVAEVFLGLLKGDPSSYLSQDPMWKPTLTGTGSFTMVDLLNTAGVVVPV